MKTLKQEQFLPISIEQAWDFFSSPKNLNEITPEDMTFKITSEMPAKMYAGMFITYKVSPMLNIALDWATEITHINAPHFFIDEQRKGPFNIWHHEHHFKAVEGGVLMTDLLTYDVGKLFLGAIASWLFVDKRVEQIFSYRRQKLEQFFGKKS